MTPWKGVAALVVFIIAYVAWRDWSIDDAVHDPLDVNDSMEGK